MTAAAHRRRTMRPAADLDRPNWPASVPFLAVHAVALATPFVAPFEWRWLALAAATYAVRMFAITAGYHRYFSHRAYRTSRAFQLLLAVAGASAAQKGPLWWAAHHRDHHRFSDGPEDVHSPLERGFWWSHVGWILARRHEATKLDRVKDHFLPSAARQGFRWWQLDVSYGVLRALAALRVVRELRRPRGSARPARCAGDRPAAGPVPDAG